MSPEIRQEEKNKRYPDWKLEVQLYLFAYNIILCTEYPKECTEESKGKATTLVQEINCISVHKPQTIQKSNKNLILFIIASK